MKKTQGPFQVIESENFGENQSDPFRNYECENYQTCLSLAAALDWDNFHCCDCTGSIDNSVLWKAKRAEQNDNVVGRICDLPDPSLNSVKNNSEVKVLKKLKLAV